MRCCQIHRMEKFHVEMESQEQTVIALAGNPNVGKSTLFNALTGLRQHTGNWPGKTVSQAQGTFKYKDRSFLLVDLPGTYSLLSNSADEEVARDFICFGEPDITLVMVDATSLERNLNLALQVMEITSQVIVCVNLMDEADRKGLSIDLNKLSRHLGVPVVGMTARSKKGLKELQHTIVDVIEGKIECKPHSIPYSKEVETAIAKVEPEIKKILKGLSINSRWISLRFIDGEENILHSIEHYLEPSSKKEGFEEEVNCSCHNSLKTGLHI